MTSEPLATHASSQASLKVEAEVPIALGHNGPGAAAILAAGFGVFAIGLMTILSEAFTGVHDWLEFVERVGPLSGKTIMAAVGWLVVWSVLATLWWKRDVPLAAIAVLTLALIVIGNLLMFPPIFQATAK